MPESDQLRCPQCGYSLLGLTAPQCPECGTPVRVVHINTTMTLALVTCRLLAAWLVIRAF